MEIFLWFCLTAVSLQIIGSALCLKDGQYPRVTLTPIFDEAGRPAQMEARSITPYHDKKRIVVRFAVVLWLMYLLTN